MYTDDYSFPSVDDPACEHGIALDVHCCHCHSGFIFDKNHECPDAAELAVMQPWDEADVCAQLLAQVDEEMPDEEEEGGDA